MLKRFIIPMVLSSIFVGELANARIWQVEKDGSGDFTIIQQAVNAAEDGDIIEIGPGRFDDYVTQTPSPYFDIFVDIRGKSLELHGSGVEVTIIGPEELDFSGYPSYLVYKRDGPCDLLIRDISFENATDQAFVLTGGHSEIYDCSFSGDSVNGTQLVGVIAYGETNSLVSNCTFSGYFGGIFVGPPSNGFLVEGCEFTAVQVGVTFNWSGTTQGVARNCSFFGGTLWSAGGVSFTEGATGEVTGCYFTGLSNFGVGTSGGGAVEVYDNVFEQGSGAGILVYNCHGLNVHDNIISSEEKCIWIWYPNAEYHELQIHNNHLIRGSQGYYVVCPDGAGYSYDPPRHLDMRYNYWGTTDTAEIDQWILDGNDFPNVEIFVDYLPLADGPVSTEEQTLDGVKALYR